VQIELIRAARARRIEQRENRQRFAVRRRLDDPELGEARKLLAPAAHRIDRERARRQAVAQPAPSARK
jgi:hypothetical protein